MTATACFYTLATVAQTLGALLAIGGAFFVFRSLQAQTLMEGHVSAINRSLPMPVFDKIEWIDRLLGGDLSGFVADFVPLAERQHLSKPAFDAAIQAAVNLAMFGELLRRTKRWAIVSVSIIVPAIMASLALIPFADRDPGHGNWIGFIPLALALAGVPIFGWTVLLGFQDARMSGKMRREFQAGLEQSRLATTVPANTPTA